MHSFSHKLDCMTIRMPDLLLLKFAVVCPLFV